MLQIIAFGEVLIDMHSTHTLGEKVTFQPFTGGAPANVAVGLAKLQAPAYFMGGVSADPFAHMILHDLNRYGVKTDWLEHFPDANTALAFVHLDEQGERSFSFYRDRTADLLFQGRQADQIDWTHTLLHLCSNTLTHTDIREVSLRLMQQSQSQGGLVSFDVNYRANLWSDESLANEHIDQAIRLADIVKFSREELQALGYDEKRLTAELIEVGVQLILITDAAHPVYAYGRGLLEPICIQPPQPEVVDTTAGGDSFMAGLLYQLASKMTSASSVIPVEHLEAALTFACRCSAFTVSQKGAFEALPTLADL